MGARGAWEAQSAESLAPDFSPRHSLMVEAEPHIGLHENTAEPAWESFRLPLPLTCSHALSQKINNVEKNF